MDLLIELETALHQHKVRASKVQIERLLHQEFNEVGISGCRYDFQTIWDSRLNDESSTTIIHSQDFKCIELSSGIILYCINQPHLMRRHVITTLLKDHLSGYLMVHNGK